MHRTVVRRASALIVCLAFLIATAPGALATATPTAAPTSYKAAPQSTIAPYDADEPQKLSPDNLYATSAILIDAKTGKVLFAKEPDRKIYPASTTKIMSVLLALENGNPDDIVTVSSAIDTVVPTIMGLKKNEEIPLQDLLYGMMLISANDAAAAVAVHIGDSLTGFADMMNERAMELGCENTNFITPHGLPITPKDNHYSTAADMAKIARAAMKNEMFRKIVSATEYTVAKTNKNAANKLKTKDAFLSDSGDEKFSYPYGIGIKTGFTNAAGQAFVGAASKDGVELIAVVLGSTKEGKWEDTIKLMNYGFNGFAPLDIYSIYGKAPAEFHIIGAETDDPEGAPLLLEIKEEDRDALNGIMLSAADLDEIEANFTRYTTVEDIPGVELQAPITRGQAMATLTFQYGDMQPIVIELVAAQDIAAKESPLSVQPTQLDDIRENATDKAVNNWWVYLLLIPAGLFIVFSVGLLLEYMKRRRRRASSRYAYGGRTRRYH